MAAPERPQHLDQAEVIIDLRDHVVQQGLPNLIIDLREAEGDAAARAGSEAGRGPSGRPRDLLPGHRLVTIDGGDLWMAAEAFVYDCYVSIGYTKANATEQVEELARWADDSRFHAVIDDDEQIIGTVRTIFGTYDDLPVGLFERTAEVEPDPVCELSSLVVSPTARSTGVIEHLYRAGWLDAWASGSNAVVALIDRWLFEVFQEEYHLPFRLVGPARDYMGTEPAPVAMALEGRAYEPMAQTNPMFWAWTLEALTAAQIVEWGLPITLVEPVDRAELDDRAPRSPASRDA